jgi:aminoglycoside phosphotransferase (APT) family kinase protein
MTTPALPARARTDCARVPIGTTTDGRGAASGRHQDEIDGEGLLAGRLIGRQFPRWAGLPIARVRSAGTDHAIYRLGDDMAVRLPRHARAAAAVAKEHRLLPVLAPQLPLAIPAPLGHGAPDGEYPYPWSVYRWLDGHNLADQPDLDQRHAAGQLGRFVAALRQIDPAGGPRRHFAAARSARSITESAPRSGGLGQDGTLDPALATTAWQAAMAAPAWTSPPAWVHADLHPANLLARRDRITAIIDFGELGTGDPAIDLLPAWALLTARTRDLFRAEASADDATWTRGRGWALGLGIGAVHYYRATNPVLAAIGLHSINQAIADYQLTG